MNSTLEIKTREATVHLCSALRVVVDSIWKSGPFLCQYQAPVDDWASLWGELTGVQRRGRMNVGWFSLWCRLWLIKKNHGAFDVSQAVRRFSGWLLFFLWLRSKWLLWRVKALWPHRLLQLESEREPGDEVASSTSTLPRIKKIAQAERWQQPLQKHSGWSWRAAHWHHWSHSLSLLNYNHNLSLPPKTN